MIIKYAMVVVELETRILVKTEFPNLAFITDTSFTTPLGIVENYSLNIGKNDLQVYL